MQVCAQSLTMSFMYEVNKGRTQQYQPFKKQNQSVCHTADLICLSANKHANHIFRLLNSSCEVGLGFVHNKIKYYRIFHRLYVSFSMHIWGFLHEEMRDLWWEWWREHLKWSSVKVVLSAIMWGHIKYAVKKQECCNRKLWSKSD